MSKLAVIGVGICFAAQTIVAALYQPVNISAAPSQAPISDHSATVTSEVRLVRLESRTSALDQAANMPHKAKDVGRALRSLHWVCDAAVNLVGTPTGKPNRAYGRVSRCERM